MCNQSITLKAPSRRNRDIFHAVRSLRKSLGDVAKERSLSKGRINAIVKQVEKWVAATTGAEAGTTWQDRLLVMEEVHRQRLDHFFDQAMAGWTKSQQDLRTEKVTQIDGKPDKKEVTTKNRDGDCKFLCTALKVEESRRTFESASEQLQHDPPAAATNSQPVAETDEQIYWQPWKQQPEAIAKAKAKVHEYAEVRGLPFPTTHLEKLKIECQMTDEWREEQARRLSGDWGRRPGESSEPQANSIWCTVYKVSSAVAAKGAERDGDGAGEGAEVELTPSWREESRRDVETAHCPQPQSPPSPQPQPSSAPKKRVLHHMSWFTPMVMTENRKRALMHPSERPPRKCPPGWEEPGSEVPPRW